MECEVASYLLEQSNTPAPTATVKQEPVEVKYTPPNDLSAPEPYRKPSLARRKPRKPLRRPKPETIEKLCSPPYAARPRGRSCEAVNNSIAPHERSLASGYWHSHHNTQSSHDSATLDPSWGNHSLVSPENSWEQVYDNWYVHPSPLHQPRWYRIPRVRNSVETSTEDSSVFSDKQQHQPPATQFQPPPDYLSRPLRSNIRICNTVPLTRFPTPIPTPAPWRHQQPGGYPSRTPEVTTNSQVPACDHRYSLTDQTNINFNNQKRKRELRLHDNCHANYEDVENCAPACAYDGEARAPPQFSAYDNHRDLSPVRIIEERINSVGNQVEEIRRDLHDLKNLSPYRHRSRSAPHSMHYEW